MSCSHRSDSQSNVINLSQLDYSKPECPDKGGPCQICQEILAVEKDAADAISRLEDVLARHQKLKAQLNHTHSPIIRDLPVEILSMIFYSCFSEEMRLKDGKRRYEDWFVPLHVGAVCRTWRQVAWSTPELWTVIVLEKMSPASYACRQYAMLEDYILRSGTLPIHVFLYDHRFRATDIGMIAERCTCWEKSLELVAQCSDRWEGAYMTLSRSTFQYIVSNLKITPPTRRLTLTSEESWEEVTDESEVFKLWPESHSGPQYVEFDLPVGFQHFSFDWQHVRHLKSTGWQIEDCLDLLRNAPQLESCCFEHVLRSGSRPFEGGSVVRHTSLRKLSFMCDTYSSKFFDCIVLPYLEELESEFRRTRNSPEVLDNPSLMTFFSQSHFPLTKLFFGEHPFTTDYLINLLDTVPSLIHLSVCFTADSRLPRQKSRLKSFLRHLATTATISPHDQDSEVSEFLPRLEVLELDISYYMPWECIPEVFGHPSELGTEGRRPLKTIVMHNTYFSLPEKGLASDLVARLVRLQEAGANINYRTGHEDNYEVGPMTWK